MYDIPGRSTGIDRWCCEDRSKSKGVGVGSLAPNSARRLSARAYINRPPRHFPLSDSIKESDSSVLDDPARRENLAGFPKLPAKHDELMTVIGALVGSKALSRSSDENHVARRDSAEVEVEAEVVEPCARERDLIMFGTVPRCNTSSAKVARCHQV